MKYEIVRTHLGTVGAYVRDDDYNMSHPLFHHVHHSPDGFEFGYGGSGPAELARSILFDHLGAAPSNALYRAFLFDKIAVLPRGISKAARHVITSDEIDAWLDKVDIYDEKSGTVIPYRETEGAK